MKGFKIREEKTITISGKDLSTLMGVRPRDFISLYPRRKEPDYCACIDLGIENCKGGVIGIVGFLTKNEISGFPEGTVKVSDGVYLSGEVWIDKEEDIAYLRIGRTPSGKDVVLNLGGDTYSQGSIVVGYINSKKMTERISFDKKVFPK